MYRASIRRHALLFRSALLALSASASVARADNVTWDGGGISVFWTDPLNWNPSGVPRSFDDVFFGRGFASGDSISLLQDRTVRSLTINTITPFRISGGGGLSPDTLLVTTGLITRLDMPGDEGLHAVDAAIDIGANAIVTVNGGGHLALGPIGHVPGASFAMNKHGTGRLVLTAQGAVSATYAGGTTVDAGTLVVTSHGLLGTGAVTVHDGATLEMHALNTSGMTYALPLAISGSGVNNFGAVRSQVGDHRWDGPITLSGHVTIGAQFNSTLTLTAGLHEDPTGVSWSLTKVDSGLLVLEGNSTFTGDTTVNGGVLRVGSPSAVGTVGIVTVARDAMLELANTVTMPNDVTIQAGGWLAGAGRLDGDLSLAGAANITVINPDETLRLGTVAGAAGFRKVGLGALELTRPSTFAGTVVAEFGALRISNADQIAGADLRVNGGATVQLRNAGSVDRPISISGQHDFTTGALHNLEGANTWAGPVTLNGDASIGAAMGTAMTVTGPITGPFNLVKRGEGTLVLTNPENTFNELHVFSGTLKVAQQDGLPPKITAARITQLPAQLRLDHPGSVSIDRELLITGNLGPNSQEGVLQNARGQNQWTGPITFDQFASIGVAAGTALSLTGPLNNGAPGNGPLMKVGPGELFVFGQNNLTEPTWVLDGALVLLAAQSAPGAPTSVFRGATLALASVSDFSASSPLHLEGAGVGGAGALRADFRATWAGPIALGGPDGAVTVGGSGFLQIRGVIDEASGSGPKTLVKTGTGLVSLEAANQYDGGTVIERGTLSIGSDSALGNPLGNVTLNAGTLSISGDVTTALTFTLHGGGGIDVGGGSTLTYDRAFVRGGVLRGNGTHVSRAAEFSGVTLGSAARLNVEDPTRLVNFTSSGTLDASSSLDWDAGTNTAGGHLIVNYDGVRIRALENYGRIDVRPDGILGLNNALVSGGGGRIFVEPGGTIEIDIEAALDLHGSLLVNEGRIDGGPINVHFGSLATGTGQFPQVVLHPGGTFTPGLAFGIRPNTSSDVATIITGGGDHVVAAPLALLADTIAVVPSDTLRITTPLSAVAGATITKLSPGTLELTHVRAAALAIEGGTVRIIPDGTQAAASILDELTIAGASALDLTDNSLTLRVAPARHAEMLARLEGYLRSARNAAAGRWRGPGLTSSAAGADPLTTLALVADADRITVAHSWNGDANLDGRINADDYFRIDQGFLAQPIEPLFAQGDFNYDETVNADDYFLIDQAFLGQTGPLAGSGNSSPPLFIPVPEPGPSLLLLAVPPALARRARRRGRR